MALWHYTVDLTWPGPGSPGVNVWDFRTDEPMLGGELQQAVDAVEAFYTSMITGGPVFPDGYSIAGRSEAIEINDRTIEPVDTWAVTQTGAEADFSGLNQMIMTIRTTSATRKGRGRKYIGPCNAATLGPDGTPITGSVTRLQTAATGLLTASQANNGWAVGVYSSVDGLFRDATQLSARNYFASMRSRRD